MPDSVNSDPAAALPVAALPVSASSGLSGRQKTVAWGTIIVWAASWVLIYKHFVASSDLIAGLPDVPYFVTIGFSASLITLGTFYIFYVTTNRTPDEAMRSALAAALFVFYVAVVTYLLVIPGLITSLGTGTPATGDKEAIQSFGQSIFTGLSALVTIVMSFYFASVAVSDKAKTDATGKVQAATITAGQPPLTGPAPSTPGDTSK